MKGREFKLLLSTIPDEAHVFTAGIAPGSKLNDWTYHPGVTIERGVSSADVVLVYGSPGVEEKK